MDDDDTDNSMDSGDDGQVESLPTHIPIFPLNGVLLLPDAKLPLNIFEPRYLDMIRDAMSGNRIIGMIQPLQRTSGQAVTTAAPALGQSMILAAPVASQPTKKPPTAVLK